MTNKIVILQNSVELYEHYINDEKWEKTLSFPKGGLTYNISNGTIKFFAFEDYLYRNCLMSMQLPIYIIDEEHDIEGEYSNIGEIVNILDEIFPTNGNGEGQDLSVYLKKREARELYQPIGDYVTTDELDEVLDDYYTKDETDGLVDGKADKDDVYTKNETDGLLDGKADKYNVYTIPEADDLLDDKLDITAYTPFDPSSYYTKIEVDNKIASAETFDPDQYYNKSESDTRFALKNEIPSLDGYATEQWVINKNYATRADFITYINNMQTQINSLIEAVSGCCETQEDVYRWLTLISQYICDNNNKYEKQQYQVSHDGGIVWENVEPAQYRKGELLEANSEDCGYAPEPQYRWKAAPTSDYLCSGTSKYYKVYYEVSYDNGQTWQHVQPEQTKRGNLIEANSPDCGYIAPQYRWKAAPTSDYLCSGTSKYYKVYYEVSYDNGQTWQHVQPEQTKRGDLIEANSPDCGYSPSLKLYGELRNGDTVNINCNSSSILTKDEVASSRSYTKAIIGTCVSTIDKNSFMSQIYLTDVTLPNTIKTIGNSAFISCVRLSGITFNEGLETIGRDAFQRCTGLTSVVLPNSLVSIGDVAFNNCSLTSVTIGTGIQHIGMSAFSDLGDIRRMEYIKILATEPPTLGGGALGTECTIYVPAASLNAYKTAWTGYASRIQPIP